jgi:hypothetical protein
MRVYADSSFLVSCYLTDANTPKARAFLLGHPEPLPFTALHDLEVRNALRLGVFRNVITDEEAKAAVSTIDTDLRSGRLARERQMAVRVQSGVPTELEARSHDWHTKSRYPAFGGQRPRFGVRNSPRSIRVNEPSPVWRA